MKNNITKYLLLACSAMVLFSACRKDSFEGDSAAGKGKDFVRITEGKVRSQFFSPFTTINEINMFSVRKDAASDGALNKANTFVLTDLGQAYITKYNTEHGTDYELLPTNMYTQKTDASIVKAGNTLTFNFAAGDFAKNYILNVDGSKFDPSKKYVIAYVLSNTGGLTAKAGKDTIISAIALKNKYDGVYSVDGSMQDFTNSTLGHINEFLSSASNTTGVSAPMEYELRTISATKCELYDNYFFGGNYIPIRSGTSYSQYGSFALVVEFDPATDKVVAVTNYYGQPAGNTRSAQLDPSGTNAYDAGAKTVKIKYRMLQPSVVVAPPNIRTVWDETWTYIGER
ncbi:DUF1735 domain-containing protein [Mucilaginibacter conchicola]|nr:DUF1735 domain-containing protein [Mucilaginibacter conchicola]